VGGINGSVATGAAGGYAGGLPAAATLVESANRLEGAGSYPAVAGNPAAEAGVVTGAVAKGTAGEAAVGGGAVPAAAAEGDAFARPAYGPTWGAICDPAGCDAAGGGATDAYAGGGGGVTVPDGVAGAGGSAGRVP